MLRFAALTAGIVRNDDQTGLGREGKQLLLDLAQFGKLEAVQPSFLLRALGVGKNRAAHNKCNRRSLAPESCQAVRKEPIWK
jgi:hypothetical protein